MPSYSKSDQLRKKDTDRPVHNPFDGKEAILQAECEELLQVTNTPYIHISNSVMQTLSRIGWGREIINLLRGLPDLMIFDRSQYPTAPPWYQLLCPVCREKLLNDSWHVEAKNKAGKLTQGQKNFAKRYPLDVIRSFEDFKEALNNFLNGG